MVDRPVLGLLPGPRRRGRRHRIPCAHVVSWVGVSGPGAAAVVSWWGSG
ncbi:hypothetical protein [Ornithinimicrobium kibberense]